MAERRERLAQRHRVFGMSQENLTAHLGVDRTAHAHCLIGKAAYRGELTRRLV